MKNEEMKRCKAMREETYIREWLCVYKRGALCTYSQAVLP